MAFRKHRARSCIFILLPFSKLKIYGSSSRYFLGNSDSVSDIWACFKTNTVSAWVLDPLANHNPAVVSVPQALKNLISPSRQTKSPDNSNILHMF